MATIEDFHKIEVRLGRIISVEDFPEARKPAYKLEIDFGEVFGKKKSSAQLVKNYPEKEKLLGKQVICLLNLSPRQIGPVRSEVLVLGVPDKEGSCILLGPDWEAPLGGKLY